MRQYCNYIFDLYGTLVDIRTDETTKDLWNKMSLFYGYYGAHYEAEELHRAYMALVQNKEKSLKQKNAVQYAHEAYPEIPIEDVFSGLYEKKGIAPDSSLVIHTGQMFRACSTRYIRLYAQAKELLAALKNAGRSIYLLSNAQRIFTEYELHYLEIHDLFDGILISSDHGCKKPDERFFQRMLKQYELKAAESLMIGNDLETDIAGAKKAGMDSFYIYSAISPRTQNDAGSQNGADYTMKRMNLKALRSKLLATD